MQLVKALVSAHEELASWRQHLHQNPEIAYEEKDTSDFVAAKLESFGVEVHRGFGGTCLLYTSPSPRDATLSRMPSSA